MPRQQPAILPVPHHIIVTSMARGALVEFHCHACRSKEMCISHHQLMVLLALWTSSARYMPAARVGELVVELAERLEIDIPTSFDEDNVRKLVQALRRKFAPHHTIITTQRPYGYRLDSETQVDFVGRASRILNSLPGY